MLKTFLFKKLVNCEGKANFNLALKNIRVKKSSYPCIHVLIL